MYIQAAATKSAELICRHEPPLPKSAGLCYFASASAITCTLSLICDCAPAGQQDCSHSPLVLFLQVACDALAHSLALVQPTCWIYIPSAALCWQSCCKHQWTDTLGKCTAAYWMRGCVGQSWATLCPSQLSLTDALLACTLTCDCTIVCQAFLASGVKGQSCSPVEWF